MTPSLSLTRLAFLLSLASCEAVPDLTFATVDAATDGALGDASGSRDGANADATADVGAMDAPEPDVGVDAPAGSACPSTPPPIGITSCCGSVACIDKQSSSCDCGGCAQQNCGSSGKMCCFDSQGNLSCVKKASDCK